jgi:hypothetical protein
MAWRGDGGLSCDFGGLKSYYLPHFHQDTGIKDKLFIFRNILAILLFVVSCPFIFSKILGATFIFNISLGAAAVFDFHQ